MKRATGLSLAPVAGVVVLLVIAYGKELPGWLYRAFLFVGDWLASLVDRLSSLF